MAVPTTRFNGVYALIRSGGWPLVVVVILCISWLTFYLTNRYAAVLVEQYGPCPDVCDALGRDCFVSKRTFRWYCVVMLLDGLVVLSLIPSRRTRISRHVWMITTIAVVPSFLLHGLIWLVYMLFAG